MTQSPCLTLPIFLLIPALIALIGGTRPPKNSEKWKNSILLVKGVSPLRSSSLPLRCQHRAAATPVDRSSWQTDRSLEKSDFGDLLLWLVKGYSGSARRRRVLFWVDEPGRLLDRMHCFDQVGVQRRALWPPASPKTIGHLRDQPPLTSRGGWPSDHGYPPKLIFSPFSLQTMLTFLY